MLSKKEIKDIQSLSHKKFRKELNLFLAEGPKIVGELLPLIPSLFNRIYATRDWISTRSKKDMDLVTEVTGQELEKISGLKTPNQVVAIIRQFGNKEPDGEDFTLYLDAIQDPGNLGTIIRTTDWFGVSAPIFFPVPARSPP